MTDELDKIGSDTSGVTDDNEDDDFADLDNILEEIDDMQRNRRSGNTSSSAVRVKNRRLVEEERRLVDEDSEEGEEHTLIWDLIEPIAPDNMLLPHRMPSRLFGGLPPRITIRHLELWEALTFALYYRRNCAQHMETAEYGSWDCKEAIKKE
ncbi:hypothetical protein LIER_21253 [Lithospermum erythrorhizon]|uniref:Uncharacterized protein n=1 Tax=Lithospermum erythrorhizon TaxID=34254 RepID=A0AAV3QR37_LITER